MSALEFNNERENDGYEEDSSEPDSNKDLVAEEINFRTTLYETALASCGFGYFQVILFLVSGWALASDSAEVQLVSFVLPTACDLEMNSTEKGWLNAIIFVGMMVGGYLLGGSADVKGRRYMLLWSMSINSVFGVSSAFAPNFEWFLFLRFMSGVGVGAAMPVIFSYCAEFMNTRRRGPVLGLLACFWMVGSILTCILAGVIIPHVEIGGRINNIYFGSWRLFVVIGAIPSISSALFMSLMPESPMFLQKHGRYDEAYDVFIRIFTRNFGSNKPIPPEIEQFAEYYNTYRKIKTAEKGPQGEDKVDNELCTLCHRVVELIKTIIKVMKSTIQLFSKPYGHTTVMLLLIWFTLSFGYYGLWMWFPEIFKRVEEGGGTTCSRVSYSVQNVTSNLTCIQKTARQKTVYMESLLVALSSLPGNILTITIINKIGRRPLMAASMILSAMSVFFFALVKDRAGMIAMSCIFSGMSVVGFNVLDMLSIEHYPTELRSSAFGLQSGFGRIAAVTGNVVFGALVDEQCAIPLLLVAVLLSVGGLIALKLPKTDDTPLT